MAFLDVWPLNEGPSHRGRARWSRAWFDVALGRAGIRRDKHEGDGATPAGVFPFRHVLYRRDRGISPIALLPATPIARDDAWCDDPADANYNRPVRLPYAGRHEQMWRADHLYDLVVVIGHNDDPPVAGLGSAVFVHVAQETSGAEFGATEGCVAFAPADLLRIVSEIRPGDSVRVHAKPYPDE